MKPYDRKCRKGCHAIAKQRARHARKQGRSHAIVLMIFLWALLSGPFRTPSVAFLPDRGTSPLPPLPRRAEDNDWPITEYERGAGGYIMRPRSGVIARTGRYRSRPSLSRLMTDLHRPAARKDATAALKARITDPVIRAWVTERIAKEEFNRLSIWVRPGRTEEAVMAAWHDEAEIALADAEEANLVSPDKASLMHVAKLLETIAGTEGERVDISGRFSYPMANPTEQSAH